VVRSSPDGSRIAFLARDKNGIQQIFLISPLGGAPIQITEHNSDVQSAPRWSHENNSIVYTWDNCIVLCEISDHPFTDRIKQLTARSGEAPSNLVWSNDGKTIAFNRLVPVEGKNEQIKQIFVINLISNI
jgi:Tol biopolymer transport system component